MGKGGPMHPSMSGTSRICGIDDVWVVGFHGEDPSGGLKIGHWGNESINVRLARPGDGAFLEALEGIGRIWHGAFDKQCIRATAAKSARWARECVPSTGDPESE